MKEDRRPKTSLRKGQLAGEQGKARRKNNTNLGRSERKTEVGFDVSRN